MNFGFAYPLVLGLFLALGLLVFQSLRRPPAGLTYSLAGSLALLVSRPQRWVGYLPLALRVAGLGLLILAAARPQLFQVLRDVRTPGVDIVLALDTSGSMEALDFELDGAPVTRLKAVQAVVSDFIRRREQDRLGLVVFGAEAFTQAPLTLDKGLLLNLVERLRIGAAGKDATAIGSAIGVGAKRLKDLEAKSRLLILLTDGRNNAGSISPEQAAEAAGVLGIKLYTIGVGGRGPAPFVQDTPFGRRMVRVAVDLDEDTLKRVAELGGGRYFRAADSRELAEIYSLIDRMEKTEVNVREFLHFKELYAFCLWPALLLLLGEITVRCLWLRTVP